jgi:mannose-6-phosphate isomerase-like protein (cupin superfamily)
MAQHLFTVAGALPVDLDAYANQLRTVIDGLAPGVPQLAVRPLASQNGVNEVLVVVRGNELPHIHPEGDLVINVLEGGGYVQLNSGIADAPAGSIVVVPEGVCHAYYNLAETDSVILATFSPINTHADCPIVEGSSPDDERTS